MPVQQPAALVTGFAGLDSGRRAAFSAPMEPIRFGAQIRYWNPEKAGGLAVADIPGDLVPVIGGLKQQRVRGRLAGLEFTSNVMPAGGGRLALSISKAMQSAAAVGVGDKVDVEITAIGREEPR